MLDENGVMLPLPLEDGKNFDGKNAEALFFPEVGDGRAALGETYYGAAKGSPNTVTLTLGTGVGGGVVVDGKIVAGKRGVGGEIGHFVVNPDDT